MKLGEFVVSIIVDAAKGNLSVKELVTRFGELDAAAALGVGTLGKMAGAFEEISLNAIEAAISLSNFHAKTGLSTERLQRLQAAGKAVNISAEGMTASISNLQSQLNDLAVGKRGAIVGIIPFLAGAGLDISKKAMKDSYVMFDQLGKLAEKMPKTKFETMMRSIGMSEMVPFFQMDKSKRKELMDAAAVMNEQQIKALNEEYAKLLIIFEQWKKIGYIISGQAAPAVTKIASQLKDDVEWMHRLTESSELAKDAMIGIGLAATRIMGPLSFLIAAFLFISSRWKEMKEGVKVIDEYVRDKLPAKLPGSLFGQVSQAIGAVKATASPILGAMPAIMTAVASPITINVHKAGPDTHVTAEETRARDRMNKLHGFTSLQNQTSLSPSPVPPPSKGK